jgi:type VI protein secretion system component VasK
MAGDSKKDSAKPRSKHDISEIREILFGEDLRNHDERFSDLESKISEIANQLQDKFNQEIDQLQKQVTSEFEKLSKLLGGLNESSSSARDDLQKMLSSQIKELEKGLRSELKDLQKVQSEDKAQLDDEKADRILLADLLTEMSTRLRGTTDDAESDSD